MNAKKNEIFDPKSYAMFLEHIGKVIKEGESYGIKHSHLPCQNLKRLA